MVEWWQPVGSDLQYVWAAGVLVAGLIAGYLVGRVNDRILRGAGVPDAVEGTSLERTARNFGTDTVSIISRGSSWIIYVVSILYALEVAELVETGVVLSRAGDLLPAYILAVLIVMIGLLAGDKAELIVSEYLRGVKFPEVSLVSTLVRYTVVFIAVLLALAQVGVAVTVLFVLFGAYLLAFIVLFATAFHQLLSSAGAGLYLLLTQPFGIGDRIEVGDRRGVVQEVNMFVTRVEENGREYIIPNHLVFKHGAVLLRD